MSKHVKRYLFSGCYAAVVACLFLTGCAYVNQSTPDKIEPKSIIEGWKGLRWGATRAEAQRRFPDCSSQGCELLCNKRDDASTFCGLRVRSMYGFNQSGRFSLLLLVPEMEDRPLLSEGILRKLGCRDRYDDGVCFLGPVRIEVDHFFKIVIIKHRLFDDTRHTGIHEAAFAPE